MNNLSFHIVPATPLAEPVRKLDGKALPHTVSDEHQLETQGGETYKKHLR